MKICKDGRQAKKQSRLVLVFLLLLTSIWSLSHKPTIKPLSNVSVQCCSQDICSEIFYKLLLKHRWQSLFLVKFHVFSIFFFWVHWDGCVWIIKIVLLGASYFTTPSPEQFKKITFRLPLTAGTKLLILDIKATFRIEQPYCKNISWKQINNEAVRAI